MSLLKNGFVKTNDKKMYHKNDLTGWHIKDNFPADMPIELWALQKHTGERVFVDWFGQYCMKMEITEVPLVKKIMESSS